VELAKIHNFHLTTSLQLWSFSWWVWTVSETARFEGFDGGGYVDNCLLGRYAT